MARITKTIGEHVDRYLGKPGELVGKYIGKPYEDITTDLGTLVSSPLNKLWRAKIFLDRATSDQPKDEANKDNQSRKCNDSLSVTVQQTDLHTGSMLSNDNWYVIGSKYVGLNEIGKEDRDINKTRKVISDTIDSNVSTNTIKPTILSQRLDGINRLPYVEDLDKDNNNNNKVIIYNLFSSPVQYIELQIRPKELQFIPETSWASIKSMGRNLPMYHYLGAEDQLQLNTSWYISGKPTDPNFDIREVLLKCRLLESWSKSDGYRAAPPVLTIQWGKTNMFEDQYFILTSATYTLSNFMDKLGRRITYYKAPRDSGLFPSTATQELIFKRVSGFNPSQKDFIGYSNGLNKFQQTTQ